MTCWEEESVIVTSGDDFIRQRYGLIIPDLKASASNGLETQTRTFGGGGALRQGGLGSAGRTRFLDSGPARCVRGAGTPGRADCPTGVMDLLLAPDQMYIQIHESIGHPVELDRILGDERNYAGTSFVTLDMFGSYVYGSPLLNVTFDPTVGGEAASYALMTRAHRPPVNF